MASNHSLQAILANNVVELTFVRRHPKLGWSDIRGLFGTTNFKLLNGDYGKYVFHFNPPKGVGMGYDYKSLNLCVVWDIFRQEYRVFGTEQVNIRKKFDVTTDQGIEEFTEYFDEYISGMSNDEKLDFMGYTGDYKIRDRQVPGPQQQGFWNNVKSKYDAVKNRIKNFFNRKK